MPINSMYTNPCCGMIAVKREVAGFDKISCRMARNRRNRSGNRRERLIDIPEPTNAGIIKRSTGQLFSSKQYR